MDYPNCEFACIDEVIYINFNPHPYVVGAKHIIEAQKYSGMLGEDVVNSLPCAAPGCNKYYKDHTSNKVAAVKITRNVSCTELRNWLQTILNWCTDNNIEGFVFIETEYEVND